MISTQPDPPVSQGTSPTADLQKAPGAPRATNGALETRWSTIKDQKIDNCIYEPKHSCLCIYYIILPHATPAYMLYPRYIIRGDRAKTRIYDRYTMCGELCGATIAAGRESCVTVRAWSTMARPRAGLQIKASRAVSPTCAVEAKDGSTANSLNLTMGAKDS